MNLILIRCQSCEHTMKFSAEKAGKKAKCSKCGAVMVIEAASEPEEEPAVVVSAAPEVSEAPPVRPVPDDPFADEGPSEYGVFVDPELEALEKKRQEEEEAAKKKKKDKKALPKVARKIKPIQDADSWDKVRLGMMFWIVGVCAWGAAHLLQGSYLLIGSVDLPEYGNLIAINMDKRVGDPLPAPGQFWNVDQFNIYMGMIAGKDYAGFAKTCLTLSTLLYFIQALAWGAGYLCCLPVPRRFGMFGMALAMMGLAVFNGLVVFFFKLLPILGVYNYIMIPYMTPEIAMTEYNMERSIAINVLWSGAPFWENFLTICFKFLQYLEPMLACVFVWSVGLSTKDEEVAEGGKGMAQMILGTFFIIFSFHLLSLCGASPVLVNVLRVFYGLWFFFLILFLLQYVMLLLKAREVLDTKIRPRYELKEEAKDDDEDEKPRKKAAKKRV